MTCLAARLKLNAVLQGRLSNPAAHALLVPLIFLTPHHLGFLSTSPCPLYVLTFFFSHKSPPPVISGIRNQVSTSAQPGTVNARECRYGQRLASWVLTHIKPWWEIECVRKIDPSWVSARGYQLTSDGKGLASSRMFFSSLTISKYFTWRGRGTRGVEQSNHERADLLNSALTRGNKPVSLTQQLSLGKNLLI